MQIRNFGIPGANSRQIIDRAFAEVEAFRPTLAIVLAGTNDCGNKDALLPPQAFRANFREMLSRLNAMDARTIAMTLPPLTDRAFKASFGEEPFQGIMPNERVKVANQIVREEAAAEGKAAAPSSSGDSGSKNPFMPNMPKPPKGARGGPPPG